MDPNSTVPKTTRDAAARHRASFPRRPRPAITRPVERRDIVVLSTDLHGGSTVVAVVARRYDTHLVIWLAHAEPELATEWDAVVEPNLTGLPYRIVVQSDLAVTCLEHRVIRFLGRIPDRVADAVGSADVTDGRSIRDLGQWHPRLGGPATDRRWAHKERELGRVQPFQAEALRTLLPDWF